MTDPEKSPGRNPGSQGITYASAGVDIDAGERAVALFKPLATKATRPEVLTAGTGRDWPGLAGTSWN